MQSRFSVGERDVGEMTQGIHRLQKGRVKCQPLGIDTVRHPAAPLFMQHAVQPGLQKAGDAPGLAVEVFCQQRQRDFTAGIFKGVAAAKGAIPVLHHRAAPLGVETFRRRGQHLLPGLFHRANKKRLPKSTPLLAQPRRHQAAVVARFG